MLTRPKAPPFSPHPHPRFLPASQFHCFASFASQRPFFFPKPSGFLRLESTKPPAPLGCESVRLGVQCDCARVLSSLSDEAELGALYAFFRELGLDTKEADSLVSRNPSVRLRCLDSLRARVASLEGVGISGLELCHLIAKCPYVLTADEVDTLIRFVRDEFDGNIDPLQLKRLFMGTDPGLLVGFDKKVNLLVCRGIPKEKIVHVLNKVNLVKALCLKSGEEIERFINFLDQYGGLDLVVKHPPILNFDLDEQLIPRVEFLLKLSGGDEEATGAVLRKLPAILRYRVEHTEGHVEFFRSFAGLEDQEIFKIFLVFPNIVSASKERKLHPRISFLKECQLNSEEIFKFLTKAPLFLGLSFEGNIAYKLAFLVKIGYRYRTKEFAFAMGAVSRTSCENLQKVIELFLSYGFSFKDILLMSKKHPQILQYNMDSLEEKLEYLVGEMGRDIEELLDFPAFLGYKLDSRIKHRYEVKKKILGEGMSLNKLLSVSTAAFSRNKVKELVQKA